MANAAVVALHRKAYEEQFEAPVEQAYAEIAQRRFEEFGTDIYPDATFTLRLSYGIVKGYEEDGNFIEPITDIAGLYDRAELHRFKPPYDPPQRWKDGRKKLNLTTPFNLVSTNDTVGGNSGSPLVNTNGEVVGIIFDGNIYSLPKNFIHCDQQGRSVSVHSAVIVESLRKLYDAAELADELGK